MIVLKLIYSKDTYCGEFEYDMDSWLPTRVRNMKRAKRFTDAKDAYHEFVDHGCLEYLKLYDVIVCDDEN